MVLNFAELTFINWSTSFYMVKVAVDRLDHGQPDENAYIFLPDKPFTVYNRERTTKFLSISLNEHILN